MFFQPCPAARRPWSSGACNWNSPFAIFHPTPRQTLIRNAFPARLIPLPLSSSADLLQGLHIDSMTIMVAHDIEVVERWSEEAPAAPIICLYSACRLGTTMGLAGREGRNGD